MRETDLPSPGRFNNSYQVRRTIVAAISAMQISKRPNGKHPAANDFSAFLTAAKAATDLMAIVPDPSFTVAPAITGTAKVGSTLTATATAAGHTRLEYQWYAGNRPTGKGAATYVPTTDDINAVITCEVKAVGASGNTSKRTAPTLRVVA